MYIIQYSIVSYIKLLKIITHLFIHCAFAHGDDDEKMMSGNFSTSYLDISSEQSKST